MFIVNMLYGLVASRYYFINPCFVVLASPVVAASREGNVKYRFIERQFYSNHVKSPQCSGTMSSILGRSSKINLKHGTLTVAYRFKYSKTLQLVKNVP